MEMEAGECGVEVSIWSSQPQRPNRNMHGWDWQAGGSQGPDSTLHCLASN